MMKSRKSLSGATSFSKKYNAIKWVIFNWTDVVKKRNEGISEVIEQIAFNTKGDKQQNLYLMC